jgi:hypothetical protein
VGRHARILLYAVVPAGVAVALNALVWTLDQPNFGWHSGWRRSGDALAIVVLMTWILWMALSVQRRRREHMVRNLYLSLCTWLAAPAIVAFALWDDQTSGRDWLSVTWYWTLEPLPMDISGAMGWTPPSVAHNSLEGVTLVALQLSTIALAVSSVVIAIDEYRTRSAARA